MNKLRNWLVGILGVNIVIAIMLEWTMFCKIAVSLNALVLLGCIIKKLLKW